MRTGQADGFGPGKFARAICWMRLLNIRISLESHFCSFPPIKHALTALVAPIYTFSCGALKESNTLNLSSPMYYPRFPFLFYCLCIFLSYILLVKKGIFTMACISTQDSDVLPSSPSSTRLAKKPVFSFSTPQQAFACRATHEYAHQRFVGEPFCASARCLRCQRRRQR